MKRLLLATLGSIGDFRPFLELAIALRSQSLDVTLASSPQFESLSARYDINFAPIGKERATDFGSFSSGQSLTIQDFIEFVSFSQLDKLSHDLVRLASGHDVLISPLYVVPAHLAAEACGVQYIAAILSPAALYPNSDGTHFQVPYRWHSELGNLRKKLALKQMPLSYTRVFSSASRVIGLHPRFLSHVSETVRKEIQVIGYPPRVTPTEPLDTELSNFCDDSTVLFTFGTHIDRWKAGRLLEMAVGATRKLGMKCVFLSKSLSSLHSKSPGSHVQIREYVDHDVLIPRARIVVHHAGLGTMVSTCRALKPSVLVPFGFDQYYNARKLGEATGFLTLALADFDEDKLVSALRETLEQERQSFGRLQEIMEAESEQANLAGFAKSL